MRREKIFETINNHISKLVMATAVYFTVIVSAMAIIGQAAGEVALIALPCEVLLWTLLFSFLIAVALVISDLLKSRNVNSIAVYGTHFILTYLSFLLVYVLLGGANAYLSGAFASQNKIFTVIIMSFFFIGIYVVVTLVKAVLLSIRKSLKNKNTAYDKIYAESERKDNK